MRFFCINLSIFLITMTGSVAADFVVTLETDDENTPGTLRNAIKQANDNTEEDTITFDAAVSTVFLAPGNGPLEVDSDHKITLDSSDFVVGVQLFGGGDSRILDVALGASLEMRNIEVSDGVAPDTTGDGPEGPNGGGIHNRGTLILQDCKIAYNTAGAGGNGGGIYNEGTLILQDCEIEDNTAGAGDIGEEGGSGGGIYSTGDGSRLEIYDSEFSVNAAGDGGAGDSIASGGMGTASDGGAGGNGGAVAAWNQTELRIARTTFEQNKAGVGGAGGNDENSGPSGNGGAGGNGGALAMEVPKQLEDTENPGSFFPLVEDSVFANNNSALGTHAAGGAAGTTAGAAGDGGLGGGGGAVYVESFDPAASGTAHITRSLFRQNSSGAGGAGNNGGAGGAGGALLVQSPSGSMVAWRLDNCTFTSNKARDGGTASGGTDGEEGNGGAIAFEAGANDYTARLNHLTITGNTAVGAGGGVWVEDNESGGGGIGFGEFGVTLGNSIVSNNSAATDSNIASGFTPEGNNLVGVAPDLDFLTDLGGETQVLPPNLTSPAIDGGGVLAEPVLVDQRGFARPKGAAPDIGAVEIGFQLDAKIGTRSNPNTHRINDFYNVSAAGQTKKLKLKKRRKKNMYFSVENDGDIADTPSVRGTKPKRKLRVKVYRITGGRVNISSAVRIGYALGNLDPGDTVAFQVQAKAKSKKKKAKQNLTYTAYTGPGSASDAVRIKISKKKNK